MPVDLGKTRTLVMSRSPGMCQLFIFCCLLFCFCFLYGTVAVLDKSKRVDWFLLGIYVSRITGFLKNYIVQYVRHGMDLLIS